MGQIDYLRIYFVSMEYPPYTVLKKIKLQGLINLAAEQFQKLSFSCVGGPFQKGRC